MGYLVKKSSRAKKKNRRKTRAKKTKSKRRVEICVNGPGTTARTHPRANMKTTTRVILTAAIVILVSSPVATTAADDDDQNTKTHVPADSPNCQTCELIANGIEIELNKLEDPSLEGLSEAEFAQRYVWGRVFITPAYTVATGRGEQEMDGRLSPFPLARAFIPSFIFSFLSIFPLPLTHCLLNPKNQNAVA